MSSSKDVWPNYNLKAVFRSGRTYLREFDQPLASLDIDEYMKEVAEGIRFEPKSNYGVALCNLAYDNNIGNCIRTSSAFGAKEVYILGSKQFNKKPCIGSYNLLDVYHIPTLEGLLETNNHYDAIIAIENNSDFPKEKTLDLESFFMFTREKLNKVLYLFGNEGFGIPKEILDVCTYQVYIPMSGRNRSVNVASACSVVCYQEFINGQ